MTTGKDGSSAIVEQLVRRPIRGAGVDGKGYNLEKQAVLMASDRVQRLEAESKKELDDIKARQLRIQMLNEALRTINAHRGEEDLIDWSKEPRLMDLIGQVQELGVQITHTDGKFSASQTRRSVENINLLLRDLNAQNEVQIKIANRLQNERYEAFQLARSITKPLHDVAITIWKNMGRS